MSDIEMVVVMRKAGWSWGAMPDAVATFMAESNGYVQAFHQNRDINGRLLSTDLSWQQINDYHHKAIRSINYANPVTAARLGRTIAIRYGLGIWNGYEHRGPFKHRANAAIRAAHARGVR